MRQIAHVALALFVAGLACAVPVALAGSDSPTIIYLHRHAEAVPPPYEESPPNPPLAGPGRERADQLARVLSNAGVTRIFSSGYNRTQETVRPLARRLELDVEAYDPRALEAFADKLKSLSGRIVVSGHSNTTPALVALLGGEPGEPIDDQTEFDRLYIVTLSADGPPTTVLLRYGP